MAKLPAVHEYMSTEALVLDPDTDIYRAVDVLLAEKASGAPVVNSDGVLVGFISEQDCLKLITKGNVEADVPVGVVSDYMTEEVITVTPDTDIYYVAGLFLAHGLNLIPVVFEGAIAGHIVRTDILRAIRRMTGTPSGTFKLP